MASSPTGSTGPAHRHPAILMDRWTDGQTASCGWGPGSVSLVSPPLVGASPRLCSELPCRVPRVNARAPAIPLPRPTWKHALIEALTSALCSCGRRRGLGEQTGGLTPFLGAQATPCPLPANWRPPPKARKAQAPLEPGAHVGSTSGGLGVSSGARDPRGLDRHLQPWMGAARPALGTPQPAPVPLRPPRGPPAAAGSLESSPRSAPPGGRVPAALGCLQPLPQPLGA